MSEYLKLNPVTLPTLKQVDIGGCLANIQHIRHFAKFLPNGRIGNFYGMTEFFGLLGRKLDVSDKYCVGQLLTDCEVKILNEKGDSMGVNEKGEIHIKPWFPCLVISLLISSSILSLIPHLINSRAITTTEFCPKIS